MTSEFRAEVSVPKASCFSRMTTSRPARASARAMARPITPAPMTAASTRSAIRSVRRCDPFRVVLDFAFEFQEFVIAAARLRREIAAALRAAFVTRADALFLVEEHAGGAEMLVFLMLQDARVFLVALFGELLGRLRFGQVMMLRHPLHFPLVNRNMGIVAD